ncbi:MAG: LacI family DNA-binding transcriptional regulator [Ilumatobacter sp.]|uniref:LacI family DNA-binding transcriptional regulator n=1 Tax=Ilumatobacter sp. TaxID=1967498 RepID=UPI003C75F628
MSKITLATVADAAGVSPAAASLALRGKSGVSTDTRHRIITTAKDLGYEMRAPVGRAATIGLLVKTHADDNGTTNAFYGPVISGITDACRTRGIDVRLAAMPVDEHFDPIEIPTLVSEPTTDGIIVLGAYLTERSADLLAGQPMVLVDGYSERADEFLSIVTDNVGGMRTATEHLIDAGHRRIALVGTTPGAFPSIRERRTGYIDAMAAAGLDPLFVDGYHDDDPQLRSDVAAAVRSDRSITAIACANDTSALACADEIQNAGLRVPGDVSVVGFDDIDAAGRVRPALTTVAVDKPAMGRIAVSMLRHRIDHPNDPAVVIAQRTHLVVRKSTRTVRASTAATT